MVIGYWLLGIGYWLLGISYWLLGIGYWVFIKQIASLGSYRVFVIDRLKNFKRGDAGTYPAKCIKSTVPHIRCGVSILKRFFSRSSF